MQPPIIFLLRLMHEFQITVLKKSLYSERLKLAIEFRYQIMDLYSTFH